MNLRPLHDRLVVKRLEGITKTESGLFIPESAKEKPQQGEVIAAGKGSTMDNGTVVPLDVKAGDLILFWKHSGSEIKIDNDTYLILRENEILGVLEA